MMKHSRKPCLHGVYAGLFGKVFTAFIAAAAVTLAYGADYYVDANNGNDAWDGTTAVIPDQATIDAGGTIAGPRKTLHAMMSDARVVAGDTVWAAEGDYKEGGTVNGEGTTTNRVQVKGGVMLRANGSRDKTFISGADGAEGKYTSGATRCVFFLPPVNEEDGYGIVKGFTLQHGRAGSEEAIKEYGGASFGAGLLVECDFLDNGCYDKNRGGTMNEGTALRCRFVSYDKGYLGYKGTKIIDSLVESSRPFYDSCYAYNCTFSGDSYLRSKGRAWNCLYIGNGASNKDQNANDTKSYHYNTFSYFEFYDGCTVVDDNCRVVNSKTAPYDPATFRPSVSSQAIDGGTLENYALATNGWKQAWLDECGKDYYGGERVVNGKIDVGCGEAQKSDIVIEDSSDGLVVVGVDAGTTRIPDDSSIDVVFSRNFTSDKLCIGVKVNGEFHSFGGTTSDVPYSVTFPAILGLSYNIEAIYEENQKDWYVSPSGDNANKGYHRNYPRKTLDKAMELATENAGHVVHAAAGTYDSFAEGEEYASANSRVTVKEGVGLVADEWPLQETVIKGASDTTSETADKHGNGTNAVRCVTVMKNGYVRGFKLTDGRTSLTNFVGTGADAGACGGGAVLYGPAALLDCEITGNGTSYRGSAVASVSTDSKNETKGWLIRCYVHTNHKKGGNYQIYDRTCLVDTYVDGGDDTAYYCRAGSIILNSTIAQGSARAWNNLYAYNSYLYNASHTGGEFKLFNCAFMGENKYDGKTIIPDESCIFNVAEEDNLGDDLRPKTASVLIDAGVNDYYDTYFPTQFEQFRNDRDVADGQRVYNGKIDIGCGEYDFRGDFARMLGSRGMIEEMGPNVTTNSLRNVVVPEGESIAMSVAPKSSDRKTRYELVYTSDGGSQTKISESSTDAFSYTLEGPCTVQSLNGYIGFVFQVR
jgi:hypothetical protein